MPEPYQFRNAWPRRFERGNIRHWQLTFSLFLRFSRLNRSFSLDRLARGRGGRARSILGLPREGFMACWWAFGAPSRSELCPPAGLTCPGRAQPNPPLTPAFARPRPMRQQPPQRTPQRHATRGAPQPSDLAVSTSPNTQTYDLPPAVTSVPWAPVGSVYIVTA